MAKGIKVTQEEIAWMEEFGTLDQPIASRGGMVFSLRSLLWVVFGLVLIYKGLMMGGSKIAGIIPVAGLFLIIPGILFLAFGIIPSKSVRREIQFLFMLNLIIKRLMSGNKNKKKVKQKKQKVTKNKNTQPDVASMVDMNYKKRQRIEKKKVVKEKKKKAKPVRITKK